MPGFMLVSGYFSSRTIRSGSETGKRIIRSAQHYVLPFFSWFILVSCLLLGGFDRNPRRAVITLMTKVDNGLWFLWVIFILSIIAISLNWALGNQKCRIVKVGIVLILYFGLLGAIGLIFGINFLGVKYVLYYSVFYGVGWLAHRTENWWKQWWPKTENLVAAVTISTFLAIIYNYDLYHCPDDLKSIVLRCIAGFTGNFVLLWICNKYETVLARAKLGWIGRYTLEIYATHMYVNNLMTAENGHDFFTVMGFWNFMISLVLTITFTAIIIVVFKSIPAMNFIFYGKRNWK